MEWLIAVALLAGAAGGFLGGRLTGADRRTTTPLAVPGSELPGGPTTPLPASPDQRLAVDGATPAPELLELIRELPGLVILVCDDEVQFASSRVAELRLTRGNRLQFDPLTECVAKVRANGAPQFGEATWRRPPTRRIAVELRIHGIPIGDRGVLLLLTDLTEEQRLAAVRRDFIANVSHELKTPVGAMSLLAEALVAAKDDPATVAHFASRMQSEATRLSQLINDVIDLSRVQGDDPLAHAQPVSVDRLVNGATDYVRGGAEAKDISIIVGGAQQLQVYGDAAQLETALRNVLSNAVAYSEPGTRVALAVRDAAHYVEIDVKDQGIGIPDAELDRIFERFYRVDEARSRVTGGTGLGLAIVRNVCRNHGGDCLVWSVEHEGSTFTLQLPRYERESL